MENFKKETYETIKSSGHNREDVMFIGSSDGKYRINMDQFDEISDFEYDPGFGGNEIIDDLIIYFKDKTYIIRGEYDGSEWWQYNVPVVYNENDPSKPFKKIKVENYESSVEELNKESVD